MEPRRLSSQSLYSDFHREVLDFRSLEESKLFQNDFEDSRRTSKERTKNFGPSVGAQYHLQKKIPVLGNQTFQLRILQENLAELVINGVLEVKDVIQYTVDEDGELSFTLSEKTNMILKRFRTKLLAATYCPKTDRSSIIVQPPLPMKLRLHLKRLL